MEVPPKRNKTQSENSEQPALSQNPEHSKTSPQVPNNLPSQSSIEKPNKSCLSNQLCLKYLVISLAIILFIAPLSITIYYLFKIWSTNEIHGTEEFPAISYQHDVSNYEWRSIHANLFFLVLIPFSFIGVTVGIIPRYAKSKETRRKVLSWFYIIFGFALSFLFFRVKSIYTLLFVILNFIFSHHLASHPKFNYFIWTLNMGFINLAFIFHGFQMDYLGESIGRFDSAAPYAWHIVLSYVIMRCLSYSLDLQRATNSRSNPVHQFHPSSCADCRHNKKCTTLSESEHLPLADYNFLNCLSYVLYPPLLYRGPIITFNDFMHQHNMQYSQQLEHMQKQQQPQQQANHHRINSGNTPTTAFQSQYSLIQENNNPEQKNSTLFGINLSWVSPGLINICHIVLLYGFVTGVNILFYPTAMTSHAQNAYIWIRKIVPGPAIFIVLGFILQRWAISMFYWKVGEFTSTANGVTVTDNIGKWIINFENIEDLLRNYERSYSRWIVRYVYVPLGGKYTKLIGIIVVLQIYVLFNEMDMRAFYWALTISAMYILEQIIFAKFHEKIHWLFMSLYGTIEMSLVLLVTIWAFTPQQDFLKYMNESLAAKKSQTFMIVIMLALSLYLWQVYLRWNQPIQIQIRPAERKRLEYQNSSTYGGMSMPKSNHHIEMISQQNHIKEFK